MINLVALGLVVTSMAIAGVWSPPPTTGLDKPHGGSGVSAAVGGEEQVIVKGGHRAVLVEYDDIDQGHHQHGKTRVSISPPEAQLSSAAAAVFGVAQDAKERMRVPGLMGEEEEEDLTRSGHLHGPRELICDAFGKCKHKISSAFHRAKDKVEEVEDDAKETVGATVDKAKEMAYKATHAGERARDKAKDVVSKAGEKVEEGGEMAKEKAREIASKAGDQVEEGKEKARDVLEEGKERARDVASKAGDKVEKGRDIVEEGKERAKQKVKKTGKALKEEVSRAGEAAGEKTKKEFADIARRGREVIGDAVAWLVSRESVDSVMSVAQLLGIATAYGVSMWVTFLMSHVLAGALPRQQFGVVQSRLYPVYFEAMAASIGFGLVGHLLGRRRKMVFSDKAEMLQAVNLLGSLGLVLANLWYYEPRASKVMFERMKLEKEEGRGTSPQPSRLGNTFLSDTAPTAATDTTSDTTTTRGTTAPAVTPTGQRRVAETELEMRSKLERLGERLKNLNSYSALLNIMTLMGLTWHLVYLSQRLLC